MSDKHEQKRRSADSHVDYMTHKANGQESDPHAGHKMSDIQATHDRHAGHSSAMFRNKFWLSFALTIPVAFWTTDVQHWLGYTAPPFPGSKFIPPILGTVVFIHGTWGELADHKPGMALKALATLLPDTPERVKGAETESVPLSELRVGDIVLVRPGENQNLDRTRLRRVLLPLSRWMRPREQDP